MNPEGLEPTISAGERQQTYAVVHAANGTDSYTLSQMYACSNFPDIHFHFANKQVKHYTGLLSRNKYFVGPSLLY